MNYDYVICDIYHLTTAHKLLLFIALLTFCAGLKLVSDDLEGSTETKDVDHFDILSDVKSACRTAVQILDDLLCFDKLESGILEIHKHEVPVMPFISECVSMFTSQAMEAGVTMSVIAPERDLHGESLTPILEGDTVYMDKFKMDQVLRNLISNALKFTPRGGVVSVSASFVPTDSGHVSRTILPQGSSFLLRGDVTIIPSLIADSWLRLTTRQNPFKRTSIAQSTSVDSDDVEHGR